ncbi:MAG TPA: 4a-hydroxytetrahydrobiopterin dehydratase [Verrucomicrobiae bacterium]|nr:4a-hydroxytetrahydrobiopterin dehydratase [Verrucomicrobiae bacterium]
MKRKTELTREHCKPCSGKTSPLTGDALKELHVQLDGTWQIINEHHLEKEYTFDNFRDALAFTNRVGEVAEKENHHPDIYLTYGKVGLRLWTHSINGLSENDFILAAKVDQRQ